MARQQPPDDPNEAIKLMRNAKEKGNADFKEEKYSSAIGNYEYALRICEYYELNKYEQTALLSNLSASWLKCGRFRKAIHYARQCIETDPDFAKGYFRMAEAYATQSASLPNNKGYDRDKSALLRNAVQHYMMSYQISEKGYSIEILCKAITLAVDQGCTNLLNLQELKAHIQQAEIEYLLTYFISKTHTRCEHIKFFHRVFASESKMIDLSKFNCSAIIDKKDLDEATVKMLIGLGAVFSRKDIDNFVSVHQESSLKVLKYCVSACRPKLEQADFDSLCEMTLASKKLKFAAHFVSCGAKPELHKVKKVINWESCVICEALVMYLAWNCKSERGNLLFQAIKHRHDSLASNMVNSFSCNQVDLTKLIASTSLSHNPKLFQELLDAGANPNGTGSPSSTKPLDAVLRLKRCPAKNKALLISSLLEKGADLKFVCAPREDGTTIIHKVTELALQTGDAHVLEVVCSRYNFPHDGKVVNKSGHTPFYFAMRKNNEISLNVCKILSKFPIIPAESELKTTDGKKQSDKRYQILQDVAKNFKTTEFEQNQISNKEVRGETKSATETQEAVMSGQKIEKSENVHAVQSEDQNQPQSDEKDKTKAAVQCTLSNNEIKQLIENVLSNEDEYFMSPDTENFQSEGHQRISKAENVSVSSCVSSEATTVEYPKPKANPAVSEENVGIEKVKIKLDDLPWEVECPEKVLKFFKDNHTPQKIRKQVIEKIRTIASGQWHGKKVRSSKSGLHLFEERVNDSIRILFQIAVQFSARCTNKLSSESSSAGKIIHVYSQVIRVWDIVLDHDKLSRSIDHCVQNIEKSHERGFQASLKIPLKRKSACNSKEKLPQLFLLSGDIDEETQQNVSEKLQCNFVPAGSTKDDEYNVITFYSFSDALAYSMLNGENARRDFPFKEWPKEHDIINLPEGKESILLLGRSGTGKTTCCLYRLWNQFQTYWILACCLGPLIPHSVLPHHNDKEDEYEDVELAKGDDNSHHKVKELKESKFAEGSDDMCNQSLATVESLSQQDTFEIESTEVMSSTSDENSEACSSADDVSANSEELEHLHQVFVTKNYVLCDQMKKRFYDMAAANDFAKDQMPYEDKEIGNSLLKVDDLAYPLFLTMRQFLLLLDNSLEDGASYFPRAKDGSLSVNILSSDYDHEDLDTLLDLEESESEDESGFADYEEYGSFQKTVKQQHVQEWREVTSTYFTENIWPKIHTEKGTDPLLVWMEIKSFIKGSREAVESERGFLTQEDYEEVGKRMAPNFQGNRAEIYEMFQQYQKFLKKNRMSNLFDECDFVHKLYHRLKHISWSVHQFYVDEVQDLTQAELLILLRCCRNPNNLFLTGDTAQSIMRGVSFRFGDLRSLFHHIQQETKLTKTAFPVRVPQLQKLMINFRSHSGILQLAASVIDLLNSFFHDSFDCLPGDEGMFPGPTPTLLQSCTVSDLALLLRSNKREASSIEFGAHQVIIVQSEESKKALPDVLKAGIVLTVFEAKGLEFDDVLLFDFFKDSKISKEWRVVTYFMENKPELIRNSATVFDHQPRKLCFDERQHKSLNPELKYLYTAITRAKCNLWIYDSSAEKRLPVFDYWCKRGLVKVVQVDDVSQEEENVLFAATSTPEEWMKQGDYFKKKRLWEPAMKCYQKSGSPDLELEAKAYFMAHQAHGKKPSEVRQLYLQAASAFLQCDKLLHSVKNLENAAKCLKNAKWHNEAARLFERLGQHDQAFKGFMKSKNFEQCANVREKVGDYSGVVKLFVKSNRNFEALSKAAAYEKRRIALQSDLCVSNLAHTFARKYSRSRDKTNLLKVLEYIPDPLQKIRFLKEAKLFDRAVDIHIKLSQYAEAYRIYTAQGKYKEGIKLAEKQANFEMVKRFVVQAAVSELKSSGSLEDGDVLKRLKQISAGINPSKLKAQACLLLGISSKDSTLCRSSLKAFRSISPACEIGEVESYAAFSNLGIQDYSMDLVISTIEACKAAIRILEAIENRKKPTASFSRILQEVEDFYYLQKQSNDIYSFSKSLDLWEFHEATTSEVDQDGMLKLAVALTLQKISKHINGYLTKWIKNDCMRAFQILERKLLSFPFHKTLCAGGFLEDSFAVYTPGRLMEYILHCIHALEVQQYRSFSTTELTRVIKNLFSPQASVHLPLSKLHLNAIRESPLACKSLEKVAINTIKTQGMDQLLEAWRIYCVLGKNTHSLESEVIDKMPTNQSHNRSQSSTERRNDMFVYYSREDRYEHIFSVFLKSCDYISKCKVLTSSKLAIHFILKHIAKSRLASTISVTNLVNMLCIHSLALLGLATHCQFLLKQPSTFLVPHFYKHVAQVFDDLNKSSSVDKWLFQACMEDVTVVNSSSSNLRWLTTDILKLLQEILDVLLGKFRHFQVLSYAMTRPHCLKNGEAKDCLVLVLTIFSNLALSGYFSEKQLLDYKRRICTTPFLSAFPAKHSLNQALTIFASSVNLGGTFLALHQLLLASDRDAHFLKLTITKQKMVLNFQKLDFQKLPSVVSFPAFPVPSTTSSEPHVGVHQESASASSNAQLLTGHASPQVHIPPSEPHQMLSQAVDNTFDWSQFPTAQTHPHSAVQSVEIQTISLPNQQALPDELPQSMQMNIPEAEEEQYDDTEDIIDDEDIHEALREDLRFEDSTEVLDSPVEKVDPADQSVIDESFCRICGVPLRSASTAVDVEHVDDESSPQEEIPNPLSFNESEETYKAHVESENHKINTIMYEKFIREVNEWQYFEFKTELRRILEECKAFEESDVTDQALDSILNAIKTELEKNEKEIEDIKRSCEWKPGLWRVENEMIDRMKSLVDRGRLEQRAQEAQQASMKQTFSRLESLTEVDEEAPEEIEYSKPVSMEREKAKKRTKKQRKRK